MRLATALVLALVLVGCGAEAGPADGGADAAPALDAPGPIEDDAAVVCTDPDQDGDGLDSIACDGRDCDDQDGDRYPGNVEVCDVDHHDEDCDPETFGFRDADMDGVPDARCCNRGADDLLVCGTDCDDLRPGVGSAVPEVCNRLDDDCDGATDEGVQRLFFPDLDGDDFGDGSAAPVRDCTPPVGTTENGTDCDDDDGGVNPGVPEMCNGVDDDCSGTADDGAAASSCALPAVATAACLSGTCAVGTCVAGFDDCDGVGSNGCEAQLATSVEHCGACGNRCASAGGSASCLAGVCELGCLAGFHACGSECVDSGAVATCGTRCTPCPAPLSDGVAACSALACSATCASPSLVVAGSGATIDCMWNDPSLATLTASAGAFSSPFAPTTLSHVLVVPSGTAAITLTPTLPAGAVATVRIGGATVAPGTASASQAIGPEPTWIDVVVTAESGASTTYRVQVVRRFAAGHYVKASNTGPGRDQFGWVVAADGDTVVVGAPFEDGDGDALTDAGAVYVFVRAASGAWSQQALLRSSNLDSRDFFGTSVAIDGDTIVVGAIGEASASGDPADDTLTRAGAAYVFVRTGTSWAQQAYLKSPAPGFSDLFGEVVAIAADTIVVGARGEDSAAIGGGGDFANEGASGSGAAFVFVRSGTSWARQAYLKASNTGVGDAFGFNVAISGDTIAVSAPAEDSASATNPANNGATDSGAVYVFTRSGSAWSQQAYLKASNIGATDIFGEGLALSGDTLVVGAPNEDSNASGVGGDQGNDLATDSGAVYVFTRSGSAWSQQAYLKASNTGAGDELGLFVAIAGDTVVAGAPMEDGSSRGIGGDELDDGAPDSGAAYVFTRAGATWIQVEYVKASNSDPYDLFGLAIAIAGDVMIVGSRGEQGDATGIDGDPSRNALAQAGAAYLLFR